MVLVIDNYDSFTYNLVQYLGELGTQLEIYRNDAITAEEVTRLKPECVIISPGPGSPKDAGVSKAIIRECGSSVPLLGVCLGHQCIGEVFGGRIVRASRLMHGKTSLIHHNGKTIFQGIKNPFEATRYHSLIVEKKTLPASLTITAETDKGEIMGLHHKRYPIWGVQFHPESILTDSGKELLNNFLTVSAAHQKKK